MNLDLAKIFPDGCKQKNIPTLMVNTDAIMGFHSRQMPGAGFMPQPYLQHTVIMAGGIVYNFTSKDAGIEILKGIAEDFNICATWRRNEEILQNTAYPKGTREYRKAELEKRNLAKNFAVTKEDSIAATKRLEETSIRYGCGDFPSGTTPS